MIGYIRQGWLVLLLGLLFGVALAGVNAWLGPKIDENQRRARETAAVKVIPGGEEARKVTVDGTTVFRVTDGAGRLVGWGVPAGGQGYADTLRLIVGVNADASELTGFRVTYNQETPGLGNKIERTEFRSRFAGRDASVRLEAVQDPEGDHEVQALTGATISSDAVARIIYEQLNETGLLSKLRQRAGVGSVWQPAPEN
ncbi:MAG: FMN-binding protein [Planctomycetota bacterium]